MDTSQIRDLSKQISETVSSILQAGSLAALVTIVESPAGMDNVGMKLLVDAFGRRVGALGPGDQVAMEESVAAEATNFLASREDMRVRQVKEFSPELMEWGEGKLLFERLQPEPRLVICGAGHVGASLARIASLLGYRATLIDDRSEFVDREHFPDARIELVQAHDWADAVRLAVGAGTGVSVAIVTRGHSEDEECLRAVIKMKVEYLGLIGSRRRTNIVLQRLRESGATEDALNAVHAPIGLYIGAVTPEEVALAIMAEIVAVRRGCEGQSLPEWRRAK